MQVAAKAKPRQKRAAPISLRQTVVSISNMLLVPNWPPESFKSRKFERFSRRTLCWRGYRLVKAALRNGVIYGEAVIVRRTINLT